MIENAWRPHDGNMHRVPKPHQPPDLKVHAKIEASSAEQAATNFRRPCHERRHTHVPSHQRRGKNVSILPFCSLQWTGTLNDVVGI